MADILVGTPVTAAQFPASVTDRDATEKTNVSSTTGVPGAPDVCEVTFTSPTSGRVIVIVSGGFRDDSSTDRTFATPEIYEGSDATGTLIIGFADRQNHQVGGFAGGSAYSHWSRRSLVSGLTPETGHYARVIYYSANGGGTADVRFREITIIPAP